ncbi:MAG: peptidoglycan-associated lipoprotein Pal [Burkholderiales bacterium]|nr:peptidoglycan-associated lipoprotein Pal [Burkholderiales bacterium]
MNKRLIYRIAVAAAALSIAACSSSIKLDDPAPVEDRSNMPADGSAAAGAGAGAGSASTNPAGSSRPVAQVTLDAKDPLQDPNNPLSRRSIYFDFDSFAIKDEYRSTLDAHAKYLTGNRAKKVVIQGNTDERGSREYNLALGQRRAEAVRRALIALGVSESQLEAVSLGEEKARSGANDDAALAENRRADLVYQ